MVGCDDYLIILQKPRVENLHIFLKLTILIFFVGYSKLININAPIANSIVV